MLFAGTDNNGLFKSSNNGKSWTAVDWDFKTSALSISRLISLGGFDIVEASDLHTGAYNNLHIEIYCSPDNGTSWKKFGGPAIPEAYSPIQPTFVLRDSTLYAWGGIYRGSHGEESGGYIAVTHDYGNPWEIIYKNSNFSVDTCAFRDSTIYAMTGGNIIVSTDNGTRWNSTFENHRVISFVVRDSSIYAASNNGIFVSTDNGTTWNFTSYDPSCTYLNSIQWYNDVIIVEDYPLLFISSEDNGVTWRSLIESRSHMSSCSIHYLW